jgi:hypothetical protein
MARRRIATRLVSVRVEPETWAALKSHCQKKGLKIYRGLAEAVLLYLKVSG